THHPDPRVVLGARLSDVDVGHGILPGAARVAVKPLAFRGPITPLSAYEPTRPHTSIQVPVPGAAPRSRQGRTDPRSAGVDRDRGPPGGVCHRGPTADPRGPGGDRPHQ